jgi:two-component system, chemotaxis family, protein-glutamate methylesterase/glutaminase
MTTLKTKKKKIRLLIVEDSPTVSQCLEYLFSSDPEIEVIGSVRNGKLAVEFVAKNKPEIITMDIDMPVMNGFEATRRIMSTTPVPIIIVTASRNAKKQNTSMDALAVGALTVIQKPVGIKCGTESAQSKKMISMVKIFSEVRVIKRKYTPKKEIAKSIQIIQKRKAHVTSQLQNRKYVAIGISSGGPEVLKKLFNSVSEKFPYPVLVVQHITDGFLDSMVSWLDSGSKAKIQIAKHKQTLLPGHIYFAPNGFQMGVKSDKIDLQNRVQGINICPSVEHLFNTLALNYGKETIAMLLTGMGSDGAKELKQLKDAGALTIAQDRKSSLVYGMPGEAIKLNGANYVLNPDEIIEIIKTIENSL